MFFFNDTATTEIYTLSLHDALPISAWVTRGIGRDDLPGQALFAGAAWRSPPILPACSRDRKSTRLNSSHANISYAVFCLQQTHRLQPHTRTAPASLRKPARPPSSPV